ncbi:MAG: class I SAM-dependent methyltransferase, partial [Deltaproteobacteria bacterium]
MSRVRKANDLWDIIGTFVYLKSIKRIDRAQSTTGYSDLQSLYRAARDGKGEGVIVELGSYKGKSSIALALGSQAGRRDKVYCVDPHRDGTRETFLKNVRAAGVEHLVVPVVAVSADAAGGFPHPIRLIFIDGDHGYEGVKSDIELWKGKVVDGGILAFHDYTFPGVKKAV